LYPFAAQSDYWKIHNLGKFMSKYRFEQLHRYFTINDEHTNPRPIDAPWSNKLQPFADVLRANCRNSYCPSFHIAIDEAMIPFTGRSKHTVKIKNELINKGYKLWAIGDHDYI
jgi:Transposase IS4